MNLVAVYWIYGFRLEKVRLLFIRELSSALLVRKVAWYLRWKLWLHWDIRSDSWFFERWVVQVWFCQFRGLIERWHSSFFHFGSAFLKRHPLTKDVFAHKILQRIVGGILPIVADDHLYCLEKVSSWVRKKEIRKLIFVSESSLESDFFYFVLAKKVESCLSSVFLKCTPSRSLPRSSLEIGNPSGSRFSAETFWSCVRMSLYWCAWLR